MTRFLFMNPDSIHLLPFTCKQVKVPTLDKKIEILYLQYKSNTQKLRRILINQNLQQLFVIFIISIVLPIMIKKPSIHQPYLSKPTAFYKYDHNNQNSAPKKVLFQTSKASRPLRQITNKLPLSYKQSKRDNQKCLKSQTSIADLSEIVAIELSSAQKKQSHIRQVQSIQRPLTHHLQSTDAFYIRRQQKQTNQPQPEDNSLRLDDFQILDVYQTTAIKKTQPIDTVSSLDNKRRLGGIRRNSRVFKDQSDLPTKKFIQCVNEGFVSNRFIQKEASTNLSARSSCQQHTRSSSIDITQIFDDEIKKCGQKMFNSICSKQKSLVQKDLQRARLTSEMRLILGPIVTKFRQKKYSELNLSAFCKQFATIIKDFQPKECLQIVKKIQQSKYLELTPQSDFHQSESVYFNEPSSLMYLSNYQVKSSQISEALLQQERLKYRHPKNPQTQVQNNAQKRLQKLTSKVDSFLNKISTQYNPRPSDKHKVSTLMSRLTQIQQLSGDSEDLASKRDSLPNEASQMDEIRKDVYVEISERKINQEQEYESKYSKKDFEQRDFNERGLDERQRYQRDEFILDERESPQRDCNPFRRQVIYPLISCLSSAESTKRRLSNFSESLSRSRDSSSRKVSERLFPESSPDQIMFKRVNLQFSELSKYLY